jgi:hypothetical protein
VRIFPTFYRFRHKIKDAKLAADRATVNATSSRARRQLNQRVLQGLTRLAPNKSPR